MAADEILGISGQMDISDIQASLDKLINDLNSLGIKTEEISAKMTKSLNDIAQNSTTNSEVSKQSIQLLKAGIEEFNNSLSGVPEALKKIAAETQATEASIVKLKKRLSETTGDPQKWNELNEQLKVQQNLANKLNSEYSSMLSTFANTQQHVGILNAAIESLNAGRSISTSVTAASTATHLSAATAIGVESVAHGVNAEKITTETNAVDDNTQAYQKLAETNKESVDSKSAEAKAIDELTQKILQGKATEEEYIKTKENAEARYKQLMNERTELLEKERKTREEAYTFSVVDGKIQDNGNEMKSAASDALLERAKEIRKEADEISESLQRLSEVRSAGTQKAVSEAQKENESTNKTLDAIRAKEDELKKLNEQLEQMEAHHAKGWGEDFFKAMRQGENPLSVISNYFNEGDDIKEKKQQIAEISEELEKLRSTAEEVKGSTNDMFNNMSKEDIAKIITEDIEQLKILKNEYSEIVQIYGKNSDKAKENKQQQEEITREIVQGKEKLREMGTAYEDIVKKTKTVKQNVEDTNKETDKSTKKILDGASKIKGAFKGILKGDFSSITSFFKKAGGKALLIAAAIAAIGKSLYELTVRAEKFKEALQPLSHYLSNDNLQAIRRNILALSDETTKSVEDMAKAALQFAKVWDSLRNSPDALTIMVKSANEMGALLGKTSEEGANYLTNLASEYHMTGQEATEAAAIIATASHNSTSSFAEMADAIKSAGTYAALYGISFKEMATILGYSGNQFGGAQKAASKFSMLLMSMSKMQDEYNPSVVGMITALLNLKKAYDRGEHVENKFMARQRSIALYLIKNADKIANYGKHIDDNKAKQEALSDINAKAAVNLKKLQNAWDGFLTSINANLSPALTNILNFFTRIIGGAQKTKREVDYLANFDKIHPDINEKNPFLQTVTNKEKALATIKEDALPDFRSQTKKLEAQYRWFYKQIQNKYKHATQDAWLNSASNSLRNYFNSHRDKFTEYIPSTFETWLQETRTTYKSLNTKPINSDTELGGNGYNADDEARKQRQYREQRAEQEAQQRAENKKLAWQLYVAEQEEGIAKEHDANEKEIKQRKLDFEKKQHEIDEEEEELRQRNIQLAKSQYEKNPANENKEGFYARKLDRGVRLTDKQQDYIDTKRNLLKLQQDEDEEKRIKKITDKYKDENQKRLDIEKQYDNDIKKIQESRASKELELQNATTEKQKEELQKQINNLILAEAQAKKQKGEAIIGFDFELLKKNPDYIAAFEDLNNVSTETLNNLIELFDRVKGKAAESMSPDQLREYTDTLQQMQDELLERENPFKQVVTAQIEYQASNDKVKALENYIKALETGKNIAEATNIVEKKLGTTYKTREEAEKALAKAKNKRNKAENKYLKAVKNLHEEINELANAISGLGNTIGGTEGKILGLIGNVLTFVTQTSDSIKKIAATGAKAISTIEKASLILSIISSAIQLMQKISSLYKDSHDQYEEYAAEIKKVNDLTNAVNEYKLAVLSATQAKEKWFATSGLKDLTDAANYNKEALKGYLEAATQAQAVYQNEKGGGWLTNAMKWVGSTIGKIVSLPSKIISKGLEAIGINMNTWIGDVVKWGINGAFGGVEAIIGKSIGSIIDNSDNYKKGTTAAINNLRIETRKKTHGFLGSGIGAKSQKTENLLEWAKENGYGDLFDENMFINVEAARSIIEEQGDKLVGETKETLETLIKFKEEYDKFNEELENYVSNAYSPLADDLTNALFDWLDKGEDVMDKFKKYASDTFKDIAKEIVKTALLGQVFDSFQEKIKELYKMYSISDGSMTEKQLSQGIANATKELMTSVSNSLPMLQDVLKYMDEQFKQLGIDIAGASQSEQTATSKAIEAITADQASSLIGIGYAMQIAIEKGNETSMMISADVSTLRSYTETIMMNVSEMRDMQFQSLEQLQTINKNTAPIILIREDISNMYKLMKERY